MDYRELGRTGWRASTISLGTWAIGDDWGEVDDKDSLDALNRAVDLGVNFFDTADVYGDGRSERLLAQLRRDRNQEVIIATKAGRRLNPHLASGYTGKNITAFIDRSLQNLKSDVLDLVQLHCPPTEVYYHPELFGTLDDLTKQGENSELRRERGKGRRSNQGHRVSQRPDRSDCFQYFSATSSRLVFRFGETAQSRNSGASAAIVGHVER